MEIVPFLLMLLKKDIQGCILLAIFVEGNRLFGFEVNFVQDGGSADNFLVAWRKILSFYRVDSLVVFGWIRMLEFKDWFCSLHLCDVALQVP